MKTKHLVFAVALSLAMAASGTLLAQRGMGPGMGGGMGSGCSR
jgi:hypothetical protein